MPMSESIRSDTKRFLILAVIAAVPMLLIAAYLVHTKTQLHEINARIECHDGRKWIRTVKGDLVEWVNPDGSKPSCMPQSRP